MAKKNRDKLHNFFSHRHETVEEGFLSKFFGRVFGSNKTEKQKIISLINRAGVQDFLFYTDVRNIPNIIKHGIKVVNEIKLAEDEVYYVWSYSQQDHSINLEFDNSTRAYFWKWTKDVKFNPRNMAIVAVHPYHLYEVTQKDWFLDRAQNFVNISENIYAETFSWIMVQDINIYKEAEELISARNLPIEMYYGDHGVVKTAHKDKVKRAEIENEIAQDLQKEIDEKTRMFTEAEDNAKYAEETVIEQADRDDANAINEQEIVDAENQAQEEGLDQGELQEWQNN